MIIQQTPTVKEEDRRDVNTSNETNSEEEEDSQKKNQNCELMGSHAIADWINSINIGSFFDLSSKFVRNHSECFVYFDSYENISLWVEPYGFYSHYSSKNNKKLDFNLGSIGAGLGGVFNVYDDIHLGGGVGYFHSSLKCKEGDSTTGINGIYFGPAVQYLFSEGSVGLSLFGIGNFYNGKNSYEAKSWDVDIRVEADYMLEAPADFFITNLTFHPFGRVDYLSVFEMSHQDKKERHSSYFYSKLGMGMERVVFCNPTGVLTSRMDLGWINMSPLSSSPIKCKTSNDESFDAKPESKNQLLLGLGLLGMYKNGLLIGVDYSAALGANAPIQTGRVRFEWNW